MDNWHQHTQGNKSAKEYVEKFNEFLVICNTSIRKEELKFFLDSEPTLEMAYELNYSERVNELETAYALVQDLDSARTSHTSKSYDYKTSVPRPSPPF